MKCAWSLVRKIVLCALLVSGGFAQAQIQVTEARIGCLPIQKDSNLTGRVGNACNGKLYCSYKAPNPQAEGIPAATRNMCTQAMEIKYQCGTGSTKVAFVPGDAWKHDPAELDCRPHEAAAVAGPLEMTAPLDPPDEPCPVTLNRQSPRGLLTADYHWPPPEFLDNPKGPEESDGRVSPVLRLHAQMRDAHMLLGDAVKAYLGIPSSIQVGPLTRVQVPADPKLAPVFAQLAVTGRKAFESFAQWHPQETDLAQYVKNTNAGQNFDPQALHNAAANVLDVAYRTLWAVRANDANWRDYRRSMGWIAVSGEDDLPHRPVNTFTAPYPQYDAAIGVVGNQRIFTRFMVASAGNSLRLPAGVHGATLVAPRSIPPDERPIIPTQNKIILYIHGGGSRLEEAVPLAEQLIRAGAARGISYTVISFDMPNSGLSTPFDHTLIANQGPGGGLGSYHPPQGDPNKLPPDPPLTYGYPLLDTEEQLVLNFIDALDQQIGNVKSRIVAVMGGSLGGNMSFRLARRANQYPFLRNIVSWSVTCMQGAQDPNIVGHIGGLIGKYQEAEQPGTRHDFLDHLYNQPLIPVALPAQPQLWYRDGWEPCKSSYIQQSKFDRYEYYTPEFRRWTYRLNYEMTIYSFQEGDLYAPNHAQGPSRYLTVNSNLLLAAGDRDEHDPFYKLYSSTLDVAAKMAKTRGTTLFLRNTGHSIHDERPAFFAQQIVNFLEGPAPQSGGLGFMTVKFQSGTDGTGDWMIVTAAVRGTGQSLNGGVSVRPITPGQAASGGGKTGQKFYYKCGVKRLGKSGIPEADHCSVEVSVQGYYPGSARVDATGPD